MRCPLRLLVILTVAISLCVSCGEEPTGVATGQVVSDAQDTGTSSTGSSSTAVDETSSTTVDTTSSSSSSTTLATTSSSTSTTTTTTTVAVAAGLPTPDDVAHQYDSLCLQTNNRELVEKWFEPGVLDDLGCRPSTDSEFGGGFVEFTGCDAIEDGAGEASHSCFFYYEGGGYSLLVGDLGRGYRALAATFVVD